MAEKQDRITVKNFRVLSGLGKGSFGDVVLVTTADSSKGAAGTDKKMALKQMSKEKCLRSLHGTLVLMERRILGDLQTLDAPFCLKLICAFQTPAYLYFLTEYYSRGTVHDFNRRKVPLELEHFKMLSAELTCAIGFLHEKGIVHRDIKPDNVAIDARGHSVLIDFGLAFYKGDVRLANTCAGSPSFCAPEVLAGNTCDEMADWWGLGVTLLRTLIGKNPFCFPKDTPKWRKWKIAIQNIEKFHISQCSALQLYPDCVTSFLGGLLERNPRIRLGADRDAKQVQDHPFFASDVSKGPVDWKALSSGQLDPPFPPALWSSLAPRLPDLQLEEEPDTFEENPAHKLLFENFDTGPAEPGLL